VSPLDPQMFATIVEHAQDLLGGHANPKYSPVEVAQWIEDFVVESRAAIDQARSGPAHTAPAFRRIEEDVLIQIGLGTFFAHKLRSGVLYEIFQQTGNVEAGNSALAHYRQAREAWAAMAERAGHVYRSDVSYGRIPKRRGHWSDRLPGIDTDIAAMEEKVKTGTVQASGAAHADEAIRAATGRPSRPSRACVHTPPESFHPGQALRVSLTVSGSPAPTVVRLFYRHVDQAERWTSIETSKEGDRYTATIAADYTQSEFPLQYYFVLDEVKGAASMYPGFNKTLSNQPYFAIAKRSA
jgi:hypothetical protein